MLREDCVDAFSPSPLVESVVRVSEAPQPRHCSVANGLHVHQGRVLHFRLDDLQKPINSNQVLSVKVETRLADLKNRGSDNGVANEKGPHADLAEDEFDGFPQAILEQFDLVLSAICRGSL